MLVKIDEQQIFVSLTEHTSRLPTLVLSHPMNSSIDLEDRLGFPSWNELATSHNLLRYDCLGHGKSSQAHDYRSLTWPQLGETLCKLLAALDIDRVVLAGSSMGAATSVHAALIAPQFDISVEGMVAIAPPIFGQERKSIASAYRKWARLLRKQGAEALVKLWRTAQPTEFFEREFPQARAICLEDFLTRDPLFSAAVFEAAAASNMPVAEELKAISCPTLVLARVDDAFHPLASAEKLVRDIDGSILHVAQNADDVMSWPQLISRHLNEVSKSRRLPAMSSIAQLVATEKSF